MYFLDFITDNIKDLNKKIIYFLNNHVKLSNFSLIFSALPFTISLIFCIFSGILLKKTANDYRNYKQKMSLGEYRPTLALLLVLSFIISFSLQGMIVINYYFCDFLSIYKNSLKQSNNLIFNLVPDKCMN